MGDLNTRKTKAVKSFDQGIHLSYRSGEHGVDAERSVVKRTVIAETRLFNAALKLARTVRGRENFPQAFELGEDVVFDGQCWTSLSVEDMQIARAATKSIYGRVKGEWIEPLTAMHVTISPSLSEALADQIGADGERHLLIRELLVNASKRLCEECGRLTKWRPFAFHIHPERRDTLHVHLEMLRVGTKIRREPLLGLDRRNLERQWRREIRRDLESAGTRVRTAQVEEELERRLASDASMRESLWISKMDNVYLGISGSGKRGRVGLRNLGDCYQALLRMQRVNSAAVLEDPEYMGQGGFHAKTGNEQWKNYHDVLLGDFLEKEILEHASKHWPDFGEEVTRRAKAHVERYIQIRDRGVNLEAEVVRLQEHVDKAECERAEALQESERLRDANLQGQERICSLEQQLHDAEARSKASLREVLQDRSRLQAELAEIKKERLDTNRALAKAQEESASLKAQITDLSDSLASQIRRHERERLDTNQALAEVQEENALLQAQVAELSASLVSQSRRQKQQQLKNSGPDLGMA